MLESGEATCAEEGSLDVLLLEKPAYGRCEAKQYAQRERERGTKRYNSINKEATVTNEQQPLQKVTKSLYIVTHLGQLNFILFT